MLTIFRTAFLLLTMLTLVTGVIYPFAVTVVAQTAFPHTANGSLIRRPSNSKPDEGSAGRSNRSPSEPAAAWIGSELIGQSFTDPKYFWGRPSATAPVACNAMGGSGSNLALTNPAWIEAITQRVAHLRQADPENRAAVPIDLVTASGSGLDPHISEAAARYQIGRVARARNLDVDRITRLVNSIVERPTMGVLGQARVNVLKLNLALDALSNEPAAKPEGEPQS